MYASSMLATHLTVCCQHVVLRRPPLEFWPQVNIVAKIKLV